MCNNSLLTYSPPLSDLKILIFRPYAFSIKAFSSVIFSHTSDFFLRKKTHVYLEKSSIKVRRYLNPFMDVIGMGPLKSECISPKMHDARCGPPIAHRQQKSFESYLLTWESGRGVTLGESKLSIMHLGTDTFWYPRSHAYHIHEWIKVRSNFHWWIF